MDKRENIVNIPCDSIFLNSCTISRTAEYSVQSAISGYIPYYEELNM